MISYFVGAITLKYYKCISVLVWLTTINFPISADCKWSAWVELGCSATCGKHATNTKTREKVNEALHGGQDCAGSNMMTTKCNLPECPGLMF